MNRASYQHLAWLALVLCVCLASAAVRADENGVWSRLPPTLKTEEALVADPARDRCLLIDCGTGPEPGVWAISTATGERHEIPWSGNGPTGLRQLAAFRDENNDRFIVFDRFSNVAWSLTPDGAWTPLQLGADPRTYGSPLAYDTKRGRFLAVLNAARDVWALTLDGNTGTWAQVVTRYSMPLPREGAVFAYDPLWDRLLVHGGYVISPHDANVSYTDLWELPLDSLSWRRISADEPASCRPGGWVDEPGWMACDAINDRLVRIRRGCGNRFDVATYALADSQWHDVSSTGTGPPSILLGPIWNETAHSWLIVSEPSDSSSVGLFSLKMAPSPEWLTLARDWDVPAPRESHAATYDASRGSMIATMGQGIVSTLNDTWELTLGNELSWKRIVASNPPAARVNCSIVSNFPFGNELMFGGDMTGLTNEFLSLYPRGRPAWSPYGPPTNLPPPRTRHAAVALNSRDAMLVFGGAQSPSGSSGPALLLDTWLFNHEWRRIGALGDLPAARAGLTAIYDASRNRVIIHGGDSAWVNPNNVGSFIFNDTWALSLADSSWTLLSSVGPRRSEHSAVYDAVRDRMLVYGGVDESGNYSSDIWAFSLGDRSWSRLSPTGAAPTPRAMHTAIYDPAHDRMVVYGGGTQNWSWPVRDAWMLDFGASAIPQAEARWLAPVVAGGTAEFIAVVTSRMRATQRYTYTLDPGYAGGYVKYAGFGLLAGGESDTIHWSIAVPYSVRGEITSSFAVTCSGAPYPAAPRLATLFVDAPLTSPSTPLRTWPNPAPGPLSVAFSNARDEATIIDVFDINGRRVAEVPLGILSRGPHSMTLGETGRLRGGVYFLRLTRGSQSETRRVCFVR